MSDSIEVKYKADLSGIIKDTNTYENKLKEVETTGKKAFKSTEDAAKSAGDSIKSTLTNIAAGVVAAFSVQKIIAFATSSIEAFQEAELNARKLQVAVGVNGGLQKDFENLLSQSERLQKVSIFSDDDIQMLQTSALQFGLNSDAVEKLTPLILDFASATGQDLGSALSAVVMGTSGSERALKQYAVTIDSTMSKNDRFIDITEQLNKKFEGQAKIISETSSGSMAVLANNYDNLKESVGEALIPFANSLVKAANAMVELTETPLSETLQEEQNAFRTSRIELLSLNVGSKERVSIIKEMQSKYPEFLSNINAETATNDQLRDALEKVNNQYIFKLSFAKGKETIAPILEEEASKALAAADAQTKLAHEIDKVIQQSEKYPSANNKRIKSELEYLPVLEQGRLLAEGKVKFDAVASSSLVNLASSFDEAKKTQIEYSSATLKSSDAQKEFAKTTENLKKAFGIKDEIKPANLETGLSDSGTGDEKLAEQRKAASEKLKQQTLKDQQDARVAQEVNQIDKLKLDQKDAEDNRKLLFKEGEGKKEDADLLKDDLLAIKQIYGVEIEKETIKQAEDLRKTEEKIRLDNLSEITKAIDTDTTAKINALKEQYISVGDFSETAQKELNDKIEAAKIAGLRLQLEEAKAAGESTVEIEAKINDAIIKGNVDKNQELKDSDKKAADERKKLLQDVLNVISDVTSAAFDLFQADNQAQQDALQERIDGENEIFNTQQDELNALKENGAITDREFQRRQIELTEKRTEAEKKAAKEKKKLQAEAARTERELAIFSVIINTAKAIVAAYPDVFLAIAAGVTGALELATILSTPLPKFFKGTKSVEGSDGIDKVPAMLTKGERVVSVDKNRKNWEVYEAIDEGKLDEWIYRKHIVPALQDYQRKSEAAMIKRNNEEIGRVIYANFAGLTAYEADRLRKKGTNINNAGELGTVIGRAVADAIPKQRMQW